VRKWVQLAILPPREGPNCCGGAWGQRLAALCVDGIRRGITRPKEKGRVMNEGLARYLSLGYGFLFFCLNGVT
jgi:hypothetical protein